MADGKKFKVGMMGYSKKDVYEYIREVDETYSKNLSDLKKENAELKSRVRVLEAENADWKQKSDLITDAIVKAEGYSKDIIDKAEQSGEELRARIDRDLEAERERLRAYREKVDMLREEIAALLKEFDERLEQTGKELA